MKVESLINQIENLGINSIIGVPDSTLKELCDCLNYDKPDHINHYVPVNEGAAAAMAAGVYLGTGKPACVYMQNSGIGNAVNPIASLLNEEVYDIPALFVVGWRGEPGIADEPQHKFQGIITEDLFKLLGIKHEIIDADTNPKELESIFIKAKNELNNNKQFTIIVKKNTFEKGESRNITNDYKLIREDAIKEILKQVEPDDMIVSTTGKISREVYEQSDLILGSHQQNFLTVGAMGHASSIALALSKECKDKRVYCIDGDGAVLMHMGTLAFIAKQNPENLIHIVLNNDAHESVGGMPTGAVGLKIADLALASGYPKVYSAANIEELSAALKEAKASNRLSLIEVKVGLYSREDLIRPKESAQENKKAFMKYHGLEAN